MPTSSAHAQRIIKTKLQRVEVLASPGSGKTHTLIRRIQHLIAIGVPAQQILVLSFSKASVRELRRRMDLLCTKSLLINPSNSSTNKVMDMSGISVLTAHACALSLIRSPASSPKILTDKQLLALLKKVLRSAHNECRKGTLWHKVSAVKKQKRLAQLAELAHSLKCKSILRLLSIACAAQKTVLEIVLEATFKDLQPYSKLLPVIARRFTAAKQAQDSIDYGDMVTQAVAAISNQTSSMPYTHVLVDEYQDCSAAQVQMLAALARLPGRQIMVFGDSYQGVFGFAGSHYTPLSSAIDKVKPLTLPVSHRLTAPVAALASAVAELKSGDAIQTLSDGSAPILVHNTDLADQTRQVLQDIQKLVEDGAKSEQIVVLARTRALLAPVEAALLAEGIPAKQLGKDRDTKHVLRVLSLVQELELHPPQTKISTESLKGLLPRVAQRDNTVWTREAQRLSQAFRVKSLEGRYRLCAAIYMRLIGGVRANADLRANLNRWEPICRGYKGAHEMRTAVRNMAPAAIVTGTIHAAKGMEWPHVLVLGITDGLLPLYLSRDTAALAEERNLLYVAITRAQRTLRLYNAPAMHARSRQRFMNLSRFIDSPSVRWLMTEIRRKKR